MNKEELDKAKEELQQSSHQYREAIGENVDVMIRKIERIAFSAVLIGGSLYLTYKLVSLLLNTEKKGGKKKKSEETDDDSTVTGFTDRVSNALLEYVTIFLLNIAREKLGEFMKEDQPDEKSLQPDTEQS